MYVLCSYYVGGERHMMTTNLSVDYFSYIAEIIKIGPRI
jgi:hypothetical protein